jgi:thiol:disulfide interchange protein
MKRLALLACALIVAGPFRAAAAPSITWETAVQSIEAKVEPPEAQPGQTVTLKVFIRLFPKHLTYPTTQPDPRASDEHNEFRLPAPGDLVFVGKLGDPPGPKFKPNPGDEGGQIAYYPEGATWEFKAVVSPKAQPGERAVKVQFGKLLICNDNGCIPPGRVKTKEVSAPLRVLPGSKDIEEQYQADVGRALAVPTAITLPPPAAPGPGKSPGPPPGPPTRGDPPVPGKAPTPPPKGTDPVPANVEPPQPPPAGEAKAVRNPLSANRDYAADLKTVRDQLPPLDDAETGFWAFVATAAAWGFLTLLTPCVFPMIPITVSIFIKQNQKQGTNVLALALTYALTIVVLMSVAALTVLTFFRQLAIDPTTNVLLGALFVALALSLFGLFELTLPSSLATALDNRAARGGYVGTVFMAASFTVVSFTCVAPFLGGFGGVTASGKGIDGKLVAGAVTFATAFASPFFLLALFPSLIKKLPKSGDWMNMVKVTMGFLELAAALKFFRTAELRWLTPPQYFTYDFVLALWVAILVAMALYLFGVFRTKHDHETHDHVGPWRMLFALVALGLAVYLIPALFGGKDRNRPGGTVYAWVDSFLLPEPSAAEVVGSDLPWSPDLRRAIDDARARGGRVFVDFTGVTCTNCKLNEREVFTKPEVRELLKQYTLVQLYTDTVPEYYYDAAPGLARQNADARLNLDLEVDGFGDESLPTYVILKPEPNGKVTIVRRSEKDKYWEGLIQDVPGFAEYLRKGLK